MQEHNAHMKECIQLCWDCRTECQKALFNHCLEEGGDHVAPEHVKIMADCIQACQTAADFMVRGSSLHGVECAACAVVCEACAISCEDIDDEHMQKCADLCRQCAESCNEMAKMGKKKAA